MNGAPERDKMELEEKRIVGFENSSKMVDRMNIYESDDGRKHNRHHCCDVVLLEIFLCEYSLCPMSVHSD